MNALDTLRDDSSAAQQSTAAVAHPLHEDETHQEQMRRLHNARARQRAARHQRITR
jgi:hypothetical protein